MFVESPLYSWDGGVGVCRGPGLVDMEWLAVSDWVWVTKVGCFIHILPKSSALFSLLEKIESS